MREPSSRASATGGMQIVLAAEPSAGGVGRHVLDLAEGLPARGFRVLLVHARHGLDPAFSHRLAQRARYGYDATSIDVRHQIGGQDMAATFELRRAIREVGGADVLHAHSSKAGALARLGRWRCARRTVYTAHGWYTQNPKLGRGAHTAYRAIEVGLSTVTDAIVSVSQGEAEHAAGIGIPRRKLHVIENGIEPWPTERVAAARRDTRARLGLAEHDVVVGFLGRLQSAKAPEVAVRTFRRILDECPDAQPVLAGDGPDAEMVRATLNELGLAERVRWLKAVKGTDTIPAFDIFLLTSRYEGFPYALLEALSSSCAIVSTRVPGVAECVAHGDNGYVVDVGDVGGLAARVTSLMHDRTRLRTMRERSRHRALVYSMDRMLDRTADLYRTLHEAR
jgi:glycosyltransferase involved in cell wall biosynthesis